MNQYQLPSPESPKDPQVPTEYSDDPTTITIMRDWMARAKPSVFHYWMLGAARGCVQRGLSPEEAFKLLRERADHHNRPVEDHEIRSPVAMAYNSPLAQIPKAQSAYRAVAEMSAEEKIELLRGSKHWPDCPPSDLDKFIAHSSNVLLKMPDLPPVSFLKLLFGSYRDKGYFITLGRKLDKFPQHNTVPLEAVLDDNYILDGVQYVVPNLAVKASGINQQGNPSTRSLDMYSERNFFVAESDIGSEQSDIQFGLIHFSSSFLQRDPVLVVHSGNKSYHTWWNADGLAEERIEEYFDFTKPLMDRATRSKNQLVRLPNGTRSMAEKYPGRRQVAVYFNPRNITSPPTEESIGKSES